MIGMGTLVSAGALYSLNPFFFSSSEGLAKTTDETLPPVLVNSTSRSPPETFRETLSVGGANDGVTSGAGEGEGDIEVPGTISTEGAGVGSTIPEGGGDTISDGATEDSADGEADGNGFIFFCTHGKNTM